MLMLNISLVSVVTGKRSFIKTARENIFKILFAIFFCAKLRYVNKISFPTIKLLAIFEGFVNFSLDWKQKLVA